MAIVAAVRCQGHVLIGADSKEEDRLGAYQSVRLSRFCDAQLMWGGDGDVRILKDLRAWLEAAGGFDRLDIRRPTPDTSEHGWWLENFADRLALLNGNNLSRIRQSRVADAPAESTAMALVAGYVRDMPVLVTLSRHGVPSYGTERGWTAIGDAAERFAGILHYTLDEPPMTLSLLDAALALGKVLEASVKGTAQGGPPYQLWALSPSRIRLVLGYQEEDEGSMEDRIREALSEQP